MAEESPSSSSTAIDSSNIGFQLLKKFGWKEGTGLGVAEQGRLEPLQQQVKKNKRGLGSEEKNKNRERINDVPTSKKQDENSRKKTKAMSKRMRKIEEEEKRIQEKEFERAFFREFWPDNV
ncbi:hypothetical protein H6P81_017861 [Aristolochia fimbriata]|uniref:G-patch domain-containing protein n=1 Tax=Aristolochia fimbriata TaxID=158543 RepID=A0AAV7E2F5_ARIFI|nr:hypothetical protein H6P81_017861 [Aristolochia fimbriata]